MSQETTNAGAWEASGVKNHPLFLLLVSYYASVQLKVV